MSLPPSPTDYNSFGAAIDGQKVKSYEETRRENRRWASRMYRERHRSDYNKKARIRVKQQRDSLSEEQRERYREKKREQSKRYYQKNRTEILAKARDTYLEKYRLNQGEEAYWGKLKPRGARVALR